MKLYGSITSPYVRRLRLFLAEHAIDYKLELVNLYDDDDRRAFANLSPVRKLPLLIDQAQKVMDSHTIHDYLCDKFHLPRLTLEQSNDISIIDGALDSLIIIFYCKNSGFDDDGERLIYQLQKERLSDTFSYLEKQVKSGELKDWNYVSMCLLSLVEWAKFRNLYDFSGLDALTGWTESQQHQKGVQSTRPA
jgi:glutathione S-transferase